MEQAFFYFFAVVAVVGALLTVARKQPLDSALSLVAPFIAVAGLYLLNGAAFNAALQILVYAGAIMILVVFVIMFLNLPERELEEEKVAPRKWILAFFSLIPLGVLCLGQIQPTEFGAKAEVGKEFGGVRAVGELLFEDYMFQFELVSVLLLVAIVGSVMLAKKRI